MPASTRMPVRSCLTPAASSPRPSSVGVRPAATRRWDPSSISPPSRTRRISPAQCSARDRLRLLQDPHTLAAQNGERMGGDLGVDPPRARPASTTVTSEPRRRKACAISMPTGPPPRIRRRSGRMERSKMVSLVRKGASARPGMGGNGRARAGGDDDPARLDHGVAHDDGPSIREFRFAAQHGDPHRREPFGEIVGGDRRDHPGT